jgi:hypothetical protein
MTPLFSYGTFKFHKRKVINTLVTEQGIDNLFRLKYRLFNILFSIPSTLVFDPVSASEPP